VPAILFPHIRCIGSARPWKPATPRTPFHRISVEDFHRLIDAGIFANSDRVELIDGEMRDMPPIGADHGSSIDRLNEIFTPALIGKAIVRVQGALVLDDATELYPDLCVLRQREDRYRSANPVGDDVLLVIEVAGSSLQLDRTVKLAKYARDGIQRYWLVDLVNNMIHDHRGAHRGLPDRRPEPARTPLLRLRARGGAAAGGPRPPDPWHLGRTGRARLQARRRLSITRPANPSAVRGSLP
jgi:Uma2 family endonuclease